ncbi:hypothetical protein SISSUDRAFT_1064511 [Sistotremastrum suecicum HHB10207 ss-3]|uniref:Ribonuclease H1 N-terminal domain-containing protein n=1 Tax=Sistotremastrum suecicum HHB10207 ss-3 TaxID=1314776 RepID=A0A166AKK2_9AGAM|nr:hypothetical protein SISSUDRAFT_1064511 [Sistotremastrum suecicum HHB10207 ss-3]
MSLLANFLAAASRASAEPIVNADDDDPLQQEAASLDAEILAKVEQLVNLQLRKEHIQNRLKRKRQESESSSNSSGSSSRGPTPHPHPRPTADIRVNPFLQPAAQNVPPVDGGAGPVQVPQKQTAEFLTADMIAKIRAAIPNQAGLPSPPATPATKRYGRASSIYTGPKGRWYVVFKGRQIGVFDEWAIAEQYVYDLKNADYRSYATEQSARYVFEDATEKGMTYVIS